MELQLIEDKIVTIRDKQVILDSDVAELYGVETKRINEAVKNNPDKFPDGYIVSLTDKEFEDLRSKFSTTKLNMARTTPKAFSEKGLYMIATILKSPKATETTIAIIETFAKVRELSRSIAGIQDTTDEEMQKSLMQRSGELFSEVLNSDFQTVGTETTIELNFSVFKVKHTVKKEAKK